MKKDEKRPATSIRSTPITRLQRVGYRRIPLDDAGRGTGDER
jgi:hypothetical protein